MMGSAKGRDVQRMQRFLQSLAFTFVVGGLIGFGSFAGLISGYDLPSSTQRADAIVVLTGDRGRLAAGGELLNAGQAPRMLISGVHSSVSNSDILVQANLDQAELDCCVTLGRQARDTVGNAEETAQWARANSYNSLIIVTSDYHLPRSLLEMKRVMPEVEFIAYPVHTPPPWERPASARLWAQEYAKFATVWLRAILFDQDEDN